MEGIRDILCILRNWFPGEWSYPAINEETWEFIKQCEHASYFNDDTVLPLEERIMEKSKNFPIPFPIETVRVQELIKRKPLEKLRRNIKSTYPVIHERVLLLMAKFISHKRQFGTSVEKEFYKCMTVCKLIDRILKKRAGSFVGPYDKYKLLTGEEGASGWEDIGTSHQKPPLTLENCLSYDELKLSAMVYISGYTECINSGARSNGGVVQEDVAEDEAIIIGVIGPRFHRCGKMEYEDILITEEQNTSKNGYAKGWGGLKLFRSRETKARLMWRQMWTEFYDIDNNTLENISLPQEEDNDEGKFHERRFVKLPNLKYMFAVFDNLTYYRRISVIAESTLLEADSRAKKNGKPAFVNVVGCGLGVWMISPHQADVYVLTFLDRIAALLDTRALRHVSDVNFAYVKTSQRILEIFSKKEESEDKSPTKRWFFIEYKEHPKGGIKVHMQNREPSSKLSGEHAGKLLVLTYPWDSNAHPGNEFWFGSLTTSGDPAAACSTQVAELHNAHINPAVSASNVRVVGRHGLQTLAEYSLTLQKKRKQEEEDEEAQKILV